MNLTNVQFFLRASLSLLLLRLLLPIGALAQDRLDPVAMGKARASVASARGLGAAASNPGALDEAPLAKTTLDQDLSFSIYNLGGTIGSTYLSSSDFEQIFGRSNGWPDKDDRARLGELLQDEKLFLNAGNDLVTARWHTDQGGTFAFHYGHRIFARLNFPEDFNTVLVKGELLAERYRFINRGIGGSWATELGVSYAKHIDLGSTGDWFPSIGIGATLNLLQGVAHFELGENSIFTVDQRTINGTRGYVIQGGYTVRSAEPDGFDPAGAIGQFESALFPGSSGIGVGADIGISGVLYRRRMEALSLAGSERRDAIFYGMTVQNLGSITWNKNTYLRSQVNVHDTLTNGTISNERFQSYQGSLEPAPEFSTTLPAVFRVGLAADMGALYDNATPLILDIEGEVPLNDVPGNTVNPRLSVGADWQANEWLSLRGGMSGGGVSGFGVGLGAGVRPADWLGIDIGTSEINGIFAGKRLDLAIRVAAGLR